MGWLNALHARSAIARRRPWQAVLMLDGIRDQIIALACLRHDLNPYHGRGVDQLPAKEATTSALLREIEQHDSQLARRLSIPFHSLAASVGE